MMRAYRFKFTEIVILLVYFITVSAVVWAGPKEDLVAGLAAGGKADYSEAIRLFSRVIKDGTIERGSLASAFNNRGIAYRRKGVFDRAISDYHRAIQLKPDFATAYSNRGLAYAKQGLYDLAIADFNQAIKLDPYNADTYLKRGNAYYDKRIYDRAVTDYSRAIELKPDFLLAYYNRSDAYKHKGLPQKALMDYRKVLDLNPNFESVKGTFER
jgi:tetratricopeptide (TPR) repeat protein